MDLYIYDTGCRLLGIAESVQQATCVLRYAAAGTLEFCCSPTELNRRMLWPGRIAALRKDRRLEISPDPGGFDAFWIERVEYTQDEDGQQMLVSGIGLAGLLRRRILEQKTVLEGLSGERIDALVETNVVSPADPHRAFPMWSVQGGFLGEPVVRGSGYETVYDAVCALAEQAGSGFAVDFYPKAKRMVFRQYAGATRAADTRFGSFLLLSDDFGNLRTQGYLLDCADERTTVYVGGESGDGTAFITEVVGEEQAGFDRKELYLPAGDLQRVDSEGNPLTESAYRTLLRARGQEALHGYRREERMEGELREENAPVFRKDYGLGDWVRVRSRAFGVECALQITEVTETLDSNGERVVPTLGDGSLTRIRRLRQALRA